jgi:hypothetical protein
MKMILGATAAFRKLPNRTAFLEGRPPKVVQGPKLTIWLLALNRLAGWLLKI